MRLAIFFSSISGQKGTVVICVICGEPIEENDLFIKLTIHRLKFYRGQQIGVATCMEDGSDKKIAHQLCPIQAGAPLSLIGADGRSDV
jgi:hypothetical protein